MQTTVNVAVTGALKRANALASRAPEPGEVSPSQLADRMYVLCRWRDERARTLDEGMLSFAEPSALACLCAACYLLQLCSSFTSVLETCTYSVLSNW